MSSRSSHVRRISSELATEIDNKKKKYEEIGINKTFTECSKDIAAELRILKSNKKYTRDNLW